MTITRCEVRPGAYYDSVVLMQLQRALADLPGVLDAGVVMATPANRDLLAASDLKVDVPAGSDDLMIVIKGETDFAVGEALNQIDNLLTLRRSGHEQMFRPRGLQTATKQLPQAKWVLISVPGRFAADVAHEALELGRNVFLFSDNVPISDEIALKVEARDNGLLLMGPDCGTAIINGIGLGFANRVRRGSVGLVGASGTGLQTITSEIHNLGGGISQAIGTGGRDLSEAVGGITALQGLDLLARDQDTEVIIIVSKPPEPKVAAKLLEFSKQLSKPVIIEFIGYSQPAKQIGNLFFASGLTDSARIAADLLTKRNLINQMGSFNGDGRRQECKYLRGLFSGGTLAYEVVLGLQSFVSPIYSNVPVSQSQPLKDVWKSQQHTILDLGEDVFTQGRLHPMMDNDLRLRRLFQEASDPEVSIILLDVVLGEGAHDDPASEIAPAIAKAKEMAESEGRSLEFVVLIIGTNEDIQGIDRQTNLFNESGAIIFQSPSEVVNFISDRLAVSSERTFTAIPLETVKAPFSGINVGIEVFYESLKAQGAESVYVDWRPPAGGNEKLMALLSKMK